jgi:hypothetical protein
LRQDITTFAMGRMKVSTKEEAGPSPASPTMSPFGPQILPLGRVVHRVPANSVPHYTSIQHASTRSIWTRKLALMMSLGSSSMRA